MCRKTFKDTHGEKAPSNKTPALKESINIGTSNQLFIRGCYAEKNFSK